VHQRRHIQCVFNLCTVRAAPALHVTVAAAVTAAAALFAAGIAVAARAAAAGPGV
jgi:hypothetical protein